MSQEHVILPYEDNLKNPLMVHQRQPIKYTQHIDVKKIVMSDWVERDHIHVASVPTSENILDKFTKETPRTPFYCHYDHLMGCYPTRYATS